MKNEGIYLKKVTGVAMVTTVNSPGAGVAMVPQYFPQVQRKQCELLRHELSAHTVQVKTLQELVIQREQEHMKEKQGLVNIHGEEVTRYNLP